MYVKLNKVQSMDEAKLLDNQEERQKVYFNKPSLVLRIKSMMVDTVVVILLMILASQILNFFNVESSLIKGIALGLIVLYEPILISLNRTVGQKIMGLRVRSFSGYSKTDESKNINIFWSILRFLMKSLLGWISLLTIHSNDYGKAIHDSLANSIMTLEK